MADEIHQLLKRVDIHRGNLNILLNQAALFGPMLPLHQANHIKHEQAQIATLKQQLASLGHTLADLPDDTGGMEHFLRSLQEQVQAHLNTIPSNSQLPHIDKRSTKVILHRFLFTMCLILLTTTAYLFLYIYPQSPLDRETIRTIIRVGDSQSKDHVLQALWNVQASGNYSGHYYENPHCTTVGYGLAWNVTHKKRSYRNHVILFSDSTYLDIHDDGWFIWICLNPGIELAPEDVVRIQSTALEKEYGGVWEYSLLE